MSEKGSWHRPRSAHVTAEEKDLKYERISSKTTDKRKAEINKRLAEIEEEKKK